jgi:SAM-dependent methyltransferase
VLEVGFGPGTLLRALADRTEAAIIHGVDPSPEMRRDAGALNRAAIRAGRVVLHAATAAHTGLEGRFDRIVSVHTVALWPDLEAGLDELARLLAPGGILVLAWHGGLGKTRVSRSLRLPEDKLTRLRDALERRFDDVVRIRQDRDDVFRARGRG